MVEEEWGEVKGFGEEMVRECFFSSCILQAFNPCLVSTW
jgi:hypothetical protein